MSAAPAPGPVRIAVDALGGDHAPKAVVQGVLAALDRQPDVAVTLVGDRERVAASLKEQGGRESPRLSIVHASQVIEMGESPVEALRAKPDNSISRMLLEVHEGRAAAAFSAGSTGGVVAASTIHLTRIRGVKRPGIAIPMPTLKGVCLTVDVGANINCKPIHLLHYAQMADAYVRAVLGVKEPRVGLLNIGEEEEKGTDLVRETGALLRASGLKYIGNIEPHAVFRGEADVAVCDGFVGNVILKTAEGLAESIFTLIGGAVQDAAKADPAAGQSLKRVLGGIKAKLDYATYGGAPLLGFEGMVLIGHGRSSAEAVASAVRTAHEFVSKRVNERIRETIVASRTRRDGATA
ncbi:MAG TPA: phosphate acyltransferase PlsX [Planctomycetota bacterium]|nr:phosphate acyltransferase PlsX [Planctomycetota bacterium]